MPYCYPPDPNTKKPHFTPPPNPAILISTSLARRKTSRSFRPMSTLPRRRRWSIIKKWPRSSASSGPWSCNQACTGSTTRRHSMRSPIPRKFRGVGRIDDKTSKGEFKSCMTAAYAASVSICSTVRAVTSTRCLRSLCGAHRRVGLVGGSAHRYQEFTGTGKADSRTAFAGGHRPYRPDQTGRRFESSRLFSCCWI